MSQTVEKAAQILDLFTLDRTELSIAEIAELTNLPRSTAFRLLKTLVGTRLLDQVPETNRYRLGLKLLGLGYLVSQRLDLPRLATPVMRKVSAQARETVHLSVRDGDQGVFIAKVEGNRSLRLHTPLGRRVPLHAGASMKILLAFEDEAYIEDYLARLPEFRIRGTFPDADVLRTQLEEIRNRGYAVSYGEQTEGAAGVSAPIRDHTGVVVAGLTISGPAHRFTPEQVATCITLVTEAAPRISELLGHPQEGESDVHRTSHLHRPPPRS